MTPCVPFLSAQSPPLSPLREGDAGHPQILFLTRMRILDDIFILIGNDMKNIAIKNNIDKYRSTREGLKISEFQESCSEVG